MTSNKIIIAVLGPTASGKSHLGMDIACKYSGEIVNCDSRQIYLGMNIGTAKPSIEDQNKLKHHLFDIITPNRKFSAGEYSVQATKTIHDIWSRDKIPVLIGGTGFYFSALYEGLSSVGKNEKVASEIDLAFKKHGLQYLLDKLYRLDPLAYNKIDKNNFRRVARALEVVMVSGRPFSEAKLNSPLSFAKFVNIIVTRPRNILHKRIEQRVNEMFALGLESEVKEIIRDYGLKSSGLTSIGYREWIEYFNNNLSLEQVKEKIIIHTRQYAKRQETWFKKRPGGTIYDLSEDGIYERIFNNIAKEVT